MSNIQTDKYIVDKLVEIEAIRININQPFTWTSGIKSPIYCDNRISLSYPSLRTYIKEKLSEQIKTHYPDIDAVAGVATAGIPQGALVADHLNLPFIYIRSKTKGHGMQNRIEGRISQGMKVVIIEDLISTGSSALSAIEALNEAGIHTLATLAVFSYSLDQANNAFKAKNIPLISLSDYYTLLEKAKGENIYSPDAINLLEEWRENPVKWNG